MLPFTIGMYILAAGLIKKCQSINAYLAFVVLLGTINLFYTLGNFEIIEDYSNVLTITVGWLITVFGSIKLSKIFIKDLKKSFHNEIKNSSCGNAELKLVFLIILVFYIILTPDILANPWWNNDYSRINYMTGNSVFLRGIKLTPILLALYMVCNKNLDFRHGLILLLISIIFSFFYGSKSGMIFLVATYIIFIKIISDNSFSVLKYLTVPIFVLLIFTIYFFTYIASQDSNTLFEVLSLRFSSDAVGLQRSLDPHFIGLCSGTSPFAPILATISKLLPGVDKMDSHLSYGNCLASPLDREYPYEYLVPLFFELNGMFGLVIAIVSFCILLFLIKKIYDFIKFIGIILKVPHLSFASRVYFSYTFLAILWGGKFANYIVSDYITVVLLILIIGLIKYLISRPKLATIC